MKKPKHSTRKNLWNIVPLLACFLAFLFPSMFSADTFLICLCILFSSVSICLFLSDLNDTLSDLADKRNDKS